MKKSEQALDYVEGMTHRDYYLGLIVIVLIVLALVNWSGEFAALAVGGMVGLAIRLYMQRHTRHRA